MKTILNSIIIASALFLAGNIASAQSLKDILGKAANNSTVSDIVEKVTGVNLSKGDIKGTWNYTGSAVKLESEDIMKTAAAGVAATQIEKKLDEYLEKAGLKTGTFSFTFNEDNTFFTTVKGKNFNGTYTLSEDGKTLNLKYGKSLNSTGIVATAQINASTFELLFKADKLLDLIGKLTAASSNTTLKTLGTLAGQYDGMKIGLELQK
ncbi:MAG: DUF4923 family protein [Bacteroidales bacterium]|nr:DUF4923 family protein [Bacteroidales bacterium]